MADVQETHRPDSKQAEQNRKQQVLTRGTASAVHGIADALVIKDRDIFFLCKPDGEIPIGDEHGYGLYYNDCRFLRGYELRMAGDFGDRLASSAGQGDAMSIELTNPALQTSEKNEQDEVPKERIGTTWHRQLDGESLTLTDTITLSNFGVSDAEFPLKLRFDARFEDIFDIRGLLQEHPGKLHDPAWHDDQLVFEYDGADHRNRKLTVRFDPAPQSKDGTGVEWRIRLGAHQRQQLKVSLVASVRVVDGAQSGAARGAGGGMSDQKILERGQRTGAHRGAGSSAGETFAQVRSNSRLLDGIIDRSFKDLQILRSDNAGAEYFAAGVPWFVALFGRDSVITSIE